MVLKTKLLLCLAVYFMTILMKEAQCQSDPTTSEPTPVPTTMSTSTTLGPNDLVATDYIIIGVTSLTLAGMLAGGIYYIVGLKKQQKKEKEKLYQQYLPTAAPTKSGRR